MCPHWQVNASLPNQVQFLTRDTTPVHPLPTPTFQGGRVPDPEAGARPLQGQAAGPGYAGADDGHGVRDEG